MGPRPGKMNLGALGAGRRIRLNARGVADPPIASPLARRPARSGHGRVRGRSARRGARGRGDGGVLAVVRADVRPRRRVPGRAGLRSRLLGAGGISRQQLGQERRLQRTRHDRRRRPFVHDHPDQAEQRHLDDHRGQHRIARRLGTGRGRRRARATGWRRRRRVDRRRWLRRPGRDVDVPNMVPRSGVLQQDLAGQRTRPRSPRPGELDRRESPDLRSLDHRAVRQRHGCIGRAEPGLAAAPVPELDVHRGRPSGQR